MGPAIAAIHDCAWQLTRAADALDLHLSMGPNVTQRDVIDVLRDLGGSDAADFVPFMLTASPLSDTSHELL